MNARPTRRAALLLAAASLAALAAPALAQSAWPSRPVRIIVPYPAGGVGDIGTRAFALDCKT